MTKRDWIAAAVAFTVSMAVFAGGFLFGSNKNDVGFARAEILHLREPIEGDGFCSFQLYTTYELIEGERAGYRRTFCGYLGEVGDVVLVRVP